MATIPADGRLTSQNVLSEVTDGTAVMYIVSPGSADLGISYQISLTTLASYFNAQAAGAPTFVTSGSVYNSVSSDYRILVNKTVGSATSIILLPSADYNHPILVKDLKGDADVNPITVTFSNGQLIDGLSQIVIENPYGYFWFNPLDAGGWYDAAF